VEVVVEKETGLTKHFINLYIIYFFLFIIIYIPIRICSPRY